MTFGWLLHPVGGADIGADIASIPGAPAAMDEVTRRIKVVAEAADARGELARRLVNLDWEKPATGEVSPLAAIVPALRARPEVRLVLVCTAATHPLGDLLADALRRVPDLFGRAFASVDVVLTDSGDRHAGLSERNVVAALKPVLSGGPAGQAAEAIIPWGSGSTQLVLGIAEAATAAGVPWRWVRVDPSLDAASWPEFNPVSDSGVDPLVPLLRRWRYHDSLATLVEKRSCGLSDEQRAVLLAEADRWRQAHQHPTADGLRLLLADALARGDASSGFAVRRYVLARYHELRDRDADRPLDLVRWATARWRRRHGESEGGPRLGELIQMVREAGHGSGPADVRRSARSESGQWLLSDIAEKLNEIGIDASHRLRPPRPAALRVIRAHPDDVSVPATSAWYIRIAGNGDPALRPDPLIPIVENGADEPVAGYLGLPRGEVGLRFLILGTRTGSAANAEHGAEQINAGRDSTADWATIPGPKDGEWAADRAERLLRQRFEPIQDEMGAIVVIPTGPKGLLLPLIAAARRLASDHGIPLFLRQLNASDTMHQLPLRFGADRDLLELADRALSTIELDVAARLLDICADTRDLADRTRGLAIALRCGMDGNWPAPLDCLDRAARTAGLIAERLLVWAEFAEGHDDPAHATRALFGGCAAVECSVRASGEPAPWTRRGAMGALFQIRNRLPASHGASGLGDSGSANPLTGTAVAGLLRRAAQEATARSRRRGGAEPDLLGLLTALRAEVADRLTAETVRLAHLARHHLNPCGEVADPGAASASAAPAAAGSAAPPVSAVAAGGSAVGGSVAGKKSR